jgi:hypothetical protein
MPTVRASGAQAAGTAGDDGGAVFEGAEVVPPAEDVAGADDGAEGAGEGVGEDTDGADDGALALGVGVVPGGTPVEPRRPEPFAARVAPPTATMLTTASAVAPAARR